MRFSKIIHFFVLVLIFLIIKNNTYAQKQVDFNNYKPIKSYGEIPNDFLILSKDKYEKDIAKQAGNEKRSIKKKKNEFFLRSNFTIDRLLLSGRVLYGDPITKYINKVAKELLKDDPELLKELRIYAFKSSSVNAVCTGNGIIMVNVGLIAHLETEAELAFVLAHEMSHYIQQHSLNSYIERYKLLKGKGNYSRKSFDEKIDLMYKFSRNNEFEADSLGLLRYINSDYYTSDASGLLYMLYYSYLPYKELAVDKTFFDIDNFKIPESYFKDSVTSISEIKEIKDKYHSHPNITKRIKKAENLLADLNIDDNKGKHFIVSEEEFNYVKKIAHFEIVRLDLLHKYYGTAIYDALLLLKDYPNNEYLEVAIAKALYGLAKYKNADEYHKVAISYNRTEGEIQQIHFLLKQFNRVQLNTLALKYVLKMEEKYPTQILLEELKKDLIKELVVINGMTLSDYYSKLPEQKVLDMLLKPNAKDKSDWRATRRQNKGFYKLAFITDKKDEDFKDEFKSHYDEREKLEKEKNLSYKEKEKIKANKQKEIDKNGYKIYAKKIIVVDPFYIYYGKNNEDFISSEESKLKIDNIITQVAKDKGLQISFIKSKNLKSTDVVKYNKLSSFNEWIQERYSHGKLKVIPLFSDQVDDFATKYNTEFVYYLGVYNDRANKIGYYESNLYNIYTGKIEYSNIYSTKYISLKEIEKNIKRDFELIQK